MFLIQLYMYIDEGLVERHEAHIHSSRGSPLRSTSTTEEPEAQSKADKWMIGGTIIIGTGILGFFGFPIFVGGSACCARRRAKACRCGRSSHADRLPRDHGLRAQQHGLGDGHREPHAGQPSGPSSWGALFDGGYYWHYNELGIGGAGAPGERPGRLR